MPGSAQPGTLYAGVYPCPACKVHTQHVVDASGPDASRLKCGACDRSNYRLEWLG